MHIGHGKTGSSYLQSSLALSSQRLHELGIYYPSDPSQVRAQKGFVTSGNGALLKEAVLKRRGFAQRADRVLVSNETLFSSLAQKDFRARFEPFLARNRFDRVEMLLFIRDPVSHASSSYQQHVKRAGSVATMEEFFGRYELPRLVNRLLTTFDAIPAVGTTVANYSARRDQVLAVTEEWLGLPRGTLEIPPVKVINRSLTRSELELQRLVNERLGTSGAVLADVFCNELPHVPADEIRPPLEVQEALWERLREPIERVNARIDPSARYDRERDLGGEDRSADGRDGLFEFTREQLAVIAEAIAQSPEEGR